MAPATAPDAGPKWPGQGRGRAVESGRGAVAPAQGPNREQGIPSHQGLSRPHPSSLFLLPVHRHGHRGGDCFRLTTATAPRVGRERGPGCRRGNCQPRGQNLPPPLLRTQTLQQETEGQSRAHRGPHRAQERTWACLVTLLASHAHTHHTRTTHTGTLPPTTRLPERGSTEATPRGTVPRRIKTPIQGRGRGQAPK